MVRRTIGLVAAVVLVAGCHQPTTSSLEARQVAQLVLPLQAAAVSVLLGTKLNPDVVSSLAETSASSRALTPANVVTGSGSIPFPLDANGKSMTPSAVYETSTSTASTRRFPASGYYYDAASVQTDRLYSFTMTPVAGSTGKFTIQLYSYPMADFTVSYVAENYVVDDANASSTTVGLWAWTPETTAGVVGSENSVVTYYTDGTNDGGATTLATSTSTPAVLYGAMNPNITVVPTSYNDATALYSDPTVEAAYANYTFPAGFVDSSLASFASTLDSSALAPPAGTAATSGTTGTTWSAKTLVDTVALKRLTYYTELGTTASPYHLAQGLVVSTNETSGGSQYSRTVSRYAIDFPTKTQTLRSLTVSGAKWNGGGTANSNISSFLAVKTNVGQTTDGLITVDQSHQLWYASKASSLNSTPSEYKGLTLTQQAAGSTTYTGTLYWLWNGVGNVYAVTEADGKLSCRWTGLTTLASLTGSSTSSALTANPRSVTTTPSFLSSTVEVPLQAYGTDLSVPLNGGTFQGTFDGTQFVGVFVYGTSSTAVRVSASSVTAMGTSFTASELLD